MNSLARTSKLYEKKTNRNLRTLKTWINKIKTKMRYIKILTTLHLRNIKRVIHFTSNLKDKIALSVVNN